MTVGLVRTKSNFIKKNANAPDTALKKRCSIIQMQSKTIGLTIVSLLVASMNKALHDDYPCLYNS